jgi:phosphatidylglycerol---prolipoprotein diacylglyceryl transferase
MYPVLFQIGPLSIYSYGVMIALGVVTSLIILNHYALREHNNPDTVANLTFLMVISGFFGARFFYVIQNFQSHYRYHFLDVFKVWEGGLILYGGVFVAAIFLFMATRKLKIPLFLITDMFVPCLALTQAFGRIGCFLEGCCWGKPTHFCWGVQFPLLEGKVHPVQLYESVFCFFLFVILHQRYRVKHFQGEITLLYFILYSIARFILEFFRGDQKTLFFMLTLPQIISLVLLSVMVLVGILIPRRSPRA